MPNHADTIAKELENIRKYWKHMKDTEMSTVDVQAGLEADIACGKKRHENWLNHVPKERL